MRHWPRTFATCQAGSRSSVGRLPGGVTHPVDGTLERHVVHDQVNYADVWPDRTADLSTNSNNSATRSPGGEAKWERASTYRSAAPQLLAQKCQKLNFQVAPTHSFSWIRRTYSFPIPKRANTSNMSARVSEVSRGR